MWRDMNVAPLIRGHSTFGGCDGPGSAKQGFAPHRARDASRMAKEKPPEGGFPD
jgi:hypothetical protein